MYSENDVNRQQAGSEWIVSVARFGALDAIDVVASLLDLHLLVALIVVLTQKILPNTLQAGG